MRYLALLLAAAALSGCSWETYKNNEGRTALRQKYRTGTAVYYEDGTYSRNMRNNQFRPEQHAVPPAGQNSAEPQTQDVQRTHWQPIQKK